MVNNKKKNLVLWIIIYFQLKRSSKYNTWEPEVNLENVKEELQKFEKEYE